MIKFEKRILPPSPPLTPSFPYTRSPPIINPATLLDSGHTKQTNIIGLHLHCLFANYFSSVGGPKEGSHISAGTESESSISGIVHSVHIRTGQSDMSGPQVMSGTTMVNANPTNPGASAMPNPNSANQNNLTSSLRRTASR